MAPRNSATFWRVDGVRSGRFLDTPEFRPFHDIGNNQTIFDRLDFQPTGQDAFHLNLFMARNALEIPNNYDQLAASRLNASEFSPGVLHRATSTQSVPTPC